MTAIGITSYGIYIPRYRLDNKTIFEAIGWLNPGTFRGEKAVANYDEDSLTMVVAACRECIKGINEGSIDGVYPAISLPP